MQPQPLQRAARALLRPRAFSSAPPAAPPLSPPPPTPSRLSAMLAHNAAFVGRREFEHYNVASAEAPALEPPVHAASSAANPVGAAAAGSGTLAAVFPRVAAPAARPPPQRCVVVSCMDARLTTLLPHALGLRPGDGKVIKNAGAIISTPFGGIMRSVVVAIYELGANEVFVVGHHDCGMAVVQPTRVVERMVREGGISRETLQTLEAAGIDVKRWLAGFASVSQSVRESVGVIRNHPLVPRRVPVSGLIIDPHTGRLEVVVNGERAVAEAAAAAAAAAAARRAGGGGEGSDLGGSVGDSGAAEGDRWRDAFEGEARAPASDFHLAQWPTGLR
jgi:carbonic anhydrase